MASVRLSSKDLSALREDRVGKLRPDGSREKLGWQDRLDIVKGLSPEEIRQAVTAPELRVLDDLTGEERERAVARRAVYLAQLPARLQPAAGLVVEILEYNEALNEHVKELPQSARAEIERDQAKPLTREKGANGGSRIR